MIEPKLNKKWQSVVSSSSRGRAAAAGAKIKAEQKDQDKEDVNDDGGDAEMRSVSRS